MSDNYPNTHILGGAPYATWDQSLEPGYLRQKFETIRAREAGETEYSSWIDVLREMSVPNVFHFRRK